jgi:hypothetical protein
MSVYRTLIKGYTYKDGKLKPKATYARTIAQKKAQRTKQRFVKAARGINRP